MQSAPATAEPGDAPTRPTPAGSRPAVIRGVTSRNDSLSPASNRITPTATDTNGWYNAPSRSLGCTSSVRIAGDEPNRQQYDDRRAGADSSPRAESRQRAAGRAQSRAAESWSTPRASGYERDPPRASPGSDDVPGGRSRVNRRLLRNAAGPGRSGSHLPGPPTARRGPARARPAAHRYGWRGTRRAAPGDRERARSVIRHRAALGQGDGAPAGARRPDAGGRPKHQDHPLPERDRAPRRAQPPVRGAGDAHRRGRGPDPARRRRHRQLTPSPRSQSASEMERSRHAFERSPKSSRSPDSI